MQPAEGEHVGGLHLQNAFLRKVGLPYHPLDPSHVDPAAAARDGGAADPARAEALQVLRRRTVHPPVFVLRIVIADRQFCIITC